jgi:peptide/nickel transport system substrate-binding protein
MRKIYWYFTAYLKKHGLVMLASIVGAVIVFSFFISSIISNIESRERIYVGLVGEYTLENLPREVTEKISAGLTKIEEDGSAAPLVSERWSIEQEGRTYRFIIKEGIFWQNGKELRTEDIRYNFSDVETIITPNDIVFKLPQAFAPFPLVVSEPILIPKTEKYNIFFSRPTLIGLGPYRLTDYKKRGNRISELTMEGMQTRYVYRFYLTELDAVTAFKHGEVDILPNLTRPYDLDNWRNVSVEQRLNTNQYLAVFFNVRDEFLGNKNLRQALAYSIEKPDDESSVLGPINPKSWAYLSAGKSYAKDTERAVERMLDEIPHKPVELELTTTSLYQSEAEKIRREWESLGELSFQECQSSSSVSDKSVCENTKISVNLRVTNFPDTNDFQLLLIGQESPPDPDQYHLWHSEQSTNFTGYQNTRIDSLLERGRQVINLEERRAIYQEFQQFFLEDVPATFIRHLYTYTVSR